MATSPPAGASGPPSICALRRMRGLVPESGVEALNHLAAKVRFGKSQAPYREGGMQELLWPDFFWEPTQWWDNGRSGPAPLHPDFRHKNSTLWLDNRHKSGSVDSQRAPWNAGMKRPPESVSTSIQQHGRLAAHPGRLEVGLCWKVCEDGQITDAVDALTVLVQRGCHVPKSLFYRVLKRCIADKSLVLGRRTHALTIKSGYGGDAFLATHLIGLYASHGRLEEAMRVFSKVAVPDVYNWTTIIYAFARHGEAAQAIRLYRQLRESAVEPDNCMYLVILKACASAGDLVAGKEVHGHILESPGQPDIFVQTSVVDMYAKCGSLMDARSVFDRLAGRNVVTWNAMLAGYAQQGMGQEALALYSDMQRQCTTPPDSVTFVCLLQACATVGALQQGKQLHARIKEQGLQNDSVLGGSLLNMYAKCGSLEDARSVFDSLPDRSVITWTTMIAGYAQQGMGEEALSLYNSMQQEGLSPPDSVSFVCLLQACASVGVGALPEGKQVHAHIEGRGLQDDVVLGGSLVNMYAKCGSLEDARSVFDRLPNRDVVAWNAMLAGYAHKGMSEEAVAVYRSMQQEGITPPDSATFVSLLHACAMAAALPVGQELHAQIQERGLQADAVVGAALVNMYAKCGSMVDSQQVFDSLPERSVEAWGALAGGYTRQGDSEIVFHLLDSMSLEGIQPSGITFLNVLTVCSHVGLVDHGRKYFQAMTADYGISPSAAHYRCMVDLLGRAGHLDEALKMANTTPFPPDGRLWRSLLGACRKWDNVGIGKQAFECAVGVDEKDAAPYALMSNIYANAQMWEQAQQVQARRLKSGARKQPGQSRWTDMGGVVHTFLVGDCQCD